MPMSVVAQPRSYRILVSRGDRRPTADMDASGLREPIPEFPVPLLHSGEEEPILNLKQLLEQVYVQARYGAAIDYHQEPVPGLEANERSWVDELIP